MKVYLKLTFLIMLLSYFDGKVDTLLIQRYQVPLQLENERLDTIELLQYTGRLFKQKPPVLFGFTGYSFGCPSITFLDETIPSAPIFCDNRH